MRLDRTIGQAKIPYRLLNLPSCHSADDRHTPSQSATGLQESHGYRTRRSPSRSDLHALENGAYAVGTPAVLPALPPSEVGVAELGQGCAVHEVIQSPASGDVPDEEYPPAFPSEAQVLKEPFDPLDRLAPALTAGIRDVDMGAALGMVPGDRSLRLGAVVALSETPVEQHGDVRADEGNLGRLDGAT